MNRYKGMLDIFNSLNKDSEVLLFNGEVVQYVDVWDEPYERLAFKYGDTFFDTKDWYNETQETIIDYINENLEVYVYGWSVKI